MCKLFQEYYVTHVEACLPHLDVLLKHSVMSVFLFCYLFLHYIAPYFHLVSICFHLNLVVVAADIL